MRVFVAINEKTTTAFCRRLDQACLFLPQKTVIHIDVSDGVWTPIKSVISKKGVISHKCFFYAVHLMLPWRKIIASQWYDEMFSLIYFHACEVHDWALIKKRAQKHKQALGAVIAVSDKNYKEILLPSFVKHILVLAVPAGKSGQSFSHRALSMISFLKKKYPHVTLTVDGGMNERTAKLCKKAGADAIVSASYIWHSESPTQAYQALKKI